MVCEKYSNHLNYPFYLIITQISELLIEFLEEIGITKIPNSCRMLQYLFSDRLGMALTVKYEPIEQIVSF